jgi:Protein of unknown function (DUF2380)
MIEKQLFREGARGCHPAARFKRRSRRLAETGITACLTLLPGNPAWAEDAQTPRAIAISRFEFIDTSGEIRDQRKEHEAKLQAFSSALREDLAATGKYRVISLDCRDAACSDPSQLSEARRNGADVVIFGGVHKMSSLVQWIKVAIVEASTKEPVFERLLTFRGDNDEAWRKAEKFLAQELANHLPLKNAGGG